MVVEKPITPMCITCEVEWLLKNQSLLRVTREVECLGLGSVEWLLKIGHSLVCPVRLSG